MSVDGLFDKTKDAYSFTRYAPSGWRYVITWLIRKGLSDAEIEAVLRSKHMRWAADAETEAVLRSKHMRWAADYNYSPRYRHVRGEAVQAYGHVRGEAVQAYFERYPAYLSRKELDYLVNG